MPVLSIFEELSVIALKHIAKGVAFGIGEAILDRVVERFTNHTDQMHKALHNANERAWQTLESALTGPRVFDFLKPVDDRLIAEQMTIFLEKSQLTAAAKNHPDFCKKCLAELRIARKEGKVRANQLCPRTMAQQASALAALGTPQAVLNAEWGRIQNVAAAMEAANFPNLGRLLKTRPPNHSSPILASAVQFFFRREIETNQQLFQGLVFAKIEGMSENQEAMLGALTTLVTQHGERFAEVMDEVLNKLGVIQDAIRLLDNRFAAWRNRQAERQTKQDEWQASVTTILTLLKAENRPVQPADSFSICTDGERQAAHSLIEEYRKWPEEQRRAFPALLNKV